MTIDSSKAVRRLVILAMIAAVYAAITVALGYFAYGPIQFRVSEALHLLAFFNPIFLPGLTLGVLIANFFSPYGLVDIVFGTMASFIALILIRITRRTINNLFVASLWPTIINAIVIPFVFLIYGGEGISVASFFPFAASVAAGQFVVLTAGYLILRATRNRYIIDIVENL